jgi:hypothetical protein
MRASHKERLARLVAALDETEDEAFDERCERRFEAVVCAHIRAVMQWRGIDPASSRALRAAEARVAAFVDSPELDAADEAVLAVEREAARAKGEDPWAELSDAVDRLGRHYLDGSRPNFDFFSLIDVWAWALTQDRLLPAIPDDRYGWSENTS